MNLLTLLVLTKILTLTTSVSATSDVAFPLSQLALQKRISLNECYIELGDLGKSISTQCHVPIQIERSISLRKVSVFCDGLPASEVLDRLAGCMLLEWKLDSHGVLRLSEPGPIKRERQDLLESEREWIRDSARRILTKRAKLTDALPTELDKERVEIEGRKKKLEQANDNVSKSILSADNSRYPELFSLQHNPQEWIDGLIAKQLGLAQWNSLEIGATIVASTTPRDGALKLDPIALTVVPEMMKPNGTGKTPTELLTLMRLNVVTGKLEINHRYLPDGQVLSGATDLLTEGILTSLQEKSKYVQRLHRWDQAIDPGVLEQRLDRHAELPKAGPYQVFTLAQQLQWLHAKTGIPIIADAFRRFASIDKVYEFPTVGTWLYEFNQDRNGFGDYWKRAYVRTDHGWLMMRHQYEWRLISEEPNEASIRQIERPGELGQSPSMDVLATFAMDIDRTQEAYLDKVVCNYPLENVQGNCNILKIWKALSGSQRETARTIGLPLAELDATESQWARMAIADALWDQMIPATILASFLPGHKELPNNLRLFFEDTNGSLALSGTDNTKWIRMGETVLRQPIPFEGARFHIGYGMDSNVFWEVKSGPRKAKK